MSIRRRGFLAGSAALAGAALLPACASVPAGRTAFVQRKGNTLMRGDAPYRIVGANMWYAAWLGADAPYGNRRA